MINESQKPKRLRNLATAMNLTIFKALFVAVLPLCFHFSAFSQSGTPQFKDYPVTEIFSGKAAPLVLTKDDTMFQTRLREAARQKPNFAGHYILATWGCGAGCRDGAVIDAKTGKVYWIPHTTCCWKNGVEQPIEFRLESKLVVFSGARNEKEGDNGAHFYKFENGQWTHIRSVMAD